MKEIVTISLMVGVWTEWTGVERIEVDEPLDDLLERIRVNQINGITIIPIKAINQVTKAVNINYITDISVIEVDN